MAVVNHQIRLVSRPQGKAVLENFELVETMLPRLGERQMLVRNHYLSVDPYMRSRMESYDSYAPPQPLNEVMVGGTVGEVVASTIDEFCPGDKVTAMGGWQEYLLVDASQLGQTDPTWGLALTKIDTSDLPLSAYLGAVGMPGVSAWMGLTQICEPRQGETLVISSAAGAVGGLVGQLAKMRGCRVIGIAGGCEKCRYVMDELGFDACIDYKQHGSFRALSTEIAAAAPNGIDCCFENVGGTGFDVVLHAMNKFGRVALCGLIASYNGAPAAITKPGLILVKRLKVQGFIVFDRLDLWPAALIELHSLVMGGKLRYRESVIDGLAAAPQAFLDLLDGRSVGKQLIKLI